MKPHFADFAGFQTYLDNLGMFRMVPGLERITEVLEAAGLRRPAYIVTQVCGTNGKGSTATMLASLAQEHGIRTGIHTSPHFTSIRERIRVDGHMLPEDEWCRLADEVMKFGGESLSYFELVTAMAVLAFSRHEVQLAIMETGLGGTFDATTAMEADMVLFSPIGLDHQAVLGNSLREIAGDKAGAIRAAKPVISAPQEKAAAEELEKTAAAQKAPLMFCGSGEILKDLHPRLVGEHQNVNANLALTAWRKIKPFFIADVAEECETAKPDSREAKALENAWLPGRMQSVPPMPPEDAEEAGIPVLSPLGWPNILLDGAHNLHSFPVLALNLSRQGIVPAAVVFACLGDKDPEQLIPYLRALSAGPVFVPPIPDNPRAIQPEELARLIGSKAVPCGSMREAVESALANMSGCCHEAFNARGRNRPLLICGSLYLLAEFYKLRPDCL